MKALLLAGALIITTSIPVPSVHYDDSPKRQQYSTLKERQAAEITNGFDCWDVKQSIGWGYDEVYICVRNN